MKNRHEYSSKLQPIVWLGGASRKTLMCRIAIEIIQEPIDCGYDAMMYPHTPD